MGHKSHQGVVSWAQLRYVVGIRLLAQVPLPLLLMFLRDNLLGKYVEFKLQLLGPEAGTV